MGSLNWLVYRIWQGQAWEAPAMFISLLADDSKDRSGPAAQHPLMDSIHDSIDSSRPSTMPTTSNIPHDAHD